VQMRHAHVFGLNKKTQARTFFILVMNDFFLANDKSPSRQHTQARTFFILVMNDFFLANDKSPSRQHPKI